MNVSFGPKSTIPNPLKSFGSNSEELRFCVYIPIDNLDFIILTYLMHTPFTGKNYEEEV